MNTDRYFPTTSLKVVRDMTALHYRYFYVVGFVVGQHPYLDMLQVQVCGPITEPALGWALRRHPAVPGKRPRLP